MKKLYESPEAELVCVTSENMLAASVPGESGGFTDSYDAPSDRRPWGDLWAKSAK